MNAVSSASERSHVTILIVDAVNSTGRIAGLDPDLAEHVADTTLELVRGPIEQMGGILVTFSGDGGVAMFGWPAALEDHADRACEAAWNIQLAAQRLRDRTPPAQEPIHLRAGIHSGLVGLRELALDATRSLDLIGGTVHLAAHLERLAEQDGIVVSSETMALCQSILTSEPVGQTDALAKIGATAHRLTARPRRRTDLEIIDRFRTELIGRDEPLTRLGQVLPGTSEERCAAIIGEPGIGKSHLLAVFLRQTAEANPNLPITPIIAQQRDVGTPFTIARKILNRLAGLDAGASSGELHDHLAAIEGFEDRHDDLLDHLDQESSGGAERMDSKVKFRLMQEFAGAALHLIGNRPHLIAIEDLHLVDPESRQFLKELAASRSALSLIVTARPEAARDCATLADMTLHLAPLAPADVHRMATALAADTPLSDEEMSAIADRADGLPLAIEQFLLSRPMLASGDRGALPSGVQSLVHARLNTLEPPIKAAAQALAVIGEDIEFSLATNALRLSAEDLLRALDLLSGLAITQPFVGESIRFRHAIVAEACANTVPLARRRELHERMVIALSTGAAADKADNARLAFHAQRAGDHANALEFLWLALLQARDNFASASIVRVLAQAFESIAHLGDEADDRFVDFVLTSFESVLQMGELRMLVGHMPRVLDVSQSRDRPDKTCLATCQLAIAHWFDGTTAEGVALARKAEAGAMAMNAVPLVNYARFALALNLHASGEVHEAIAVMGGLRDALSGDLERRRMGSAGVFGAMVRSFIGYFMADIGEIEDGLQHARRALRVAEEEREPYTQLLAQLALGKLHFNSGDPNQAIGHLETGLEMIGRHGYSAARPHLTGLLASSLARIGQGKRAFRLTTEDWGAKDMEKSGTLEACVLHIGRADAALAHGDVDLAIAEAGAAKDIAERIAHPALQVRCLEQTRRLPGKTPDERATIAAEIDRLCERHGLLRPMDTVASSA